MTSTFTLTEAEFQGQVVELAGILGWHHLHVRRSIGKRNGASAHQTATNVKGWPDLLLWREGSHRLVAAELKSEKGRPTPEQLEVLASLERSGVETHVWRPSDWPTIEETLR